MDVTAFWAELIYKEKMPIVTPLVRVRSGVQSSPAAPADPVTSTISKNRVTQRVSDTFRLTQLGEMRVILRTLRIHGSRLAPGTAMFTSSLRPISLA